MQQTLFQGASMAPRRAFDEHYEEDIRLPDGGMMRLRLVRDGDRAGILRAFEQLSTETRVQRWFYPKMRLSEDEIAAIVSPLDDEHGAIAALEINPDSEKPDADAEPVIGIARFVRSKEDPDAAEIAITLADDWQGLGIGRILLHRLVSMISERDIGWIEGRLQAENQRMKHLLAPYVPEGGFQLEDSVLLFRFPVPHAEDPLMAQLSRNATAVAHMFGRMAEGGFALPAALVGQRLQGRGPRDLLANLQRNDRKPAKDARENEAEDEPVGE